MNYSTNVDYIPTLAIHPHGLVAYSSKVWNYDSRKRKNNRLLVTQSKSTQGKVSNQASRKIKRAIRYLTFLASDKKVFSAHKSKVLKFKVSFITLTLASKQAHTDNEIKNKLLNQMLIELSKYYGVTNYVWKAEKQDNGNIHFHILVDKFIPWSEIRDRWNRIQNKLGYVDNYRNNMREFFKDGFKVRPELLHKWSYRDQLNAFKKGQATSWNSPNSTDVHSVKFVSNIAAYVIKYMVKSSQSSNLSGRLWGCSTGLSNVKGACLEIDSKVEKEIEIIKSHSSVNVFNDKYFSVFTVQVLQLCRSSIPIIFSALLHFLYTTFNYSYQLFIH